MKLSRRHILKLTCLTAGMTLAAGSGVLLVKRNRPLLISGYRNQQTQTLFGILVMNADGKVIADFPVPHRVHTADLYPFAERTLVSSREPGASLRSFDFDGRSVAELSPPANMHFEGHSVFSADGKTLFTTASNYQEGLGYVLAADADTLTLQAVWPTKGTGPHELLLHDGFLYIANTGVRTHPDSNRKALNIDSMQSALVKISSRTGELLHQWHSPRQALSARHLDRLANGDLLVGCQYQLETDRPPCVTLATEPSNTLQLLEAENHWFNWNMQGYTASVRAFPASSRHAGEVLISNPRGHSLSHWRENATEFTGTSPMNHAKGIAIEENRAWITAGAGELWRWENGTMQPLLTSVKDGIWWENHLHSGIAG